MIKTWTIKYVPDVAFIDKVFDSYLDNQKMKKMNEFNVRADSKEDALLAFDDFTWRFPVKSYSEPIMHEISEDEYENN